MATYRILTFDSGGIKGLFSATLLGRVVENHPDLIKNTDLIAGTSTGGIIALGLAAGLTPQQLAELYRDRGPEIFDDSFWDDLIDLGKAVGADYSQKKLRSELEDRLGRNTTLGDLNKRVLIPTFDLDSPETGKRPRAWKPKFFHNFPGRDSDREESVVDVALRTSAAPTYFPAYQGYIDGGVVANNPSMAAVAQAIDKRAGKQKLQNVVVLSIGTGLEPKYIATRRKHLDWGWTQWARPLIALMISGMTGVADFQCKQLLGDSYRRLDSVFDRGVDLDDVEPRTLDYLVEEATAVRITGVLRWLENVGW